MPAALDIPLRFERIALEKVWGGRALETALGFDLPPGKPIGETWEVVDREGENSVVRGGPHDGRTLRELMEQDAAALLGPASPTPDGRFPLLVKFIDASANLSVQVHPDDATAAEIGGGAEGKTEAWFVVSAEPGACLYAGLKEDVTPEAFAAVADGPGVVDLLCRWEVQAGDCVLVPGGTVHAIGAGITLLEVQQNSDTTYRLYDWGRVGLDGKPRETHVEQALRCVRFGEPATSPVSTVWPGNGEGPEVVQLAASPYFSMLRTRLTTGLVMQAPPSFSVLAALDGEGEVVRVRDGDVEDVVRVTFRRGDTVLVPPSAAPWAVAPAGDTLDLLWLGPER